MRARQPYCFRAKPVHQVAILLSTWNWKQESKSLFNRSSVDRNTGLTALVCDAGHSAEVVSEHTISGHCADYPVIIVPELQYGLAAETVKELLEYAKNGGSLVLLGENVCRLFEAAGAPLQYGELIEEPWVYTLDGEAF